MISKEIVLRNLNFDKPPRIAFDFNAPGPKDIAHIAPARITPLEDGRYDSWGKHPELMIKTGFDGEMKLDAFGNILGRFEGKTKGECIAGVLERDFDDIRRYEFQPLSDEYDQKLDALLAPHRGKYILGGVPVSVFSTFRDMRRMENALLDTIEYPEYIALLLEKVCAVAEETIARAARHGFDGVLMGDDWGTQIALFISPKAFRAIFLPAYKRIADAAHRAGLHFMLHSCGFISEVIGDFIDAGVDALQLDQPELSDVSRIAKLYGGRVTLYSPVDIQKILQTGDRALIEAEARHMLREFMPHGGGLIAKDYPSLGDIDVRDEWAAWARDVFVNEGVFR